MDLDAFRALLSEEGGPLLDLPPYDEADALATGERLRREGHRPEVVAAALTQARLRGRARAKFDVDAGRMFFTAAGLEQATRRSVADLRAARLRDRGVQAVRDLCCGIGGDALAFARAGMRVVAVDRDPLACAVTRANAAALGLADRVEVRCGDVTLEPPAAADGAATFLDPARRTDRGRVFDAHRFSPPWTFVEEVLAAGSACVKVAPGIPHGLVPADVDAEWVSDGGEVTEAALWSGRLRTGARRSATLLPAGATLQVDPALRPAPVGPVGSWLFDPDGAVVRAGLVAELAATIGGRLLDGSIAYVVGDRLVPTPFAAAYRVIDVLPFGVKRLRSYLRERDVGALTVKKRGSAVTPEELRRLLRLRGSAAATVVLTRVAGEHSVLVVEPAARHQARST